MYFGGLMTETTSRRVTAVHKDRYELDHTVSFPLKTSCYYKKEDNPYPTVGDTVWVEKGFIVKTLPRRSVFLRVDPGPIPRAQAVAANFDYGVHLVVTQPGLQRKAHRTLPHHGVSGRRNPGGHPDQGRFD
jgi:hypothetical protein